MRRIGSRTLAWSFAAAASLGLSTATPAAAQRLLGIDVSAWQDSISVANWNTLHTTNDRDFVFIRSSRGGTTGFDHNHDNILSSNANCNGVSTDACLSRRYDDPYFGQNMTRATNAGLFAGSYHRSRADVIASTPNTGGVANNGTDEANHMMQMAGPWMRPGYLPPVLDFEDGDGARSDIEMAQFALDFSNRIYEVMQIRPAIYTNGNYAHFVLGGGTPTQRAQLAQQNGNPPSVVSPAFPTLWSARWPNQANPNAIDVQNDDPKDSYENIYGPWDDYGVEQPWAFWQYASTARLSGYKNGGANIDVNVSRGDIEFVKDQLIPAIWWNDASGDWSTLTNWNSGQPVVAPPVAPNMTPVQGTTTLPVARLPGAAGSGPASGQNDTVILDRPNANITVTLSSGTHNIRKLYMRETLEITGGSLTINYNPNYAVPLDGSGNPQYPNAVRSGPISAQFSGAVSLSGTGALSVHTLRVDATRTFTLGGGTLTFDKIGLMPHASNPATIAVTGDVNIDPLNNATATIENGSGEGSSGRINLAGGAIHVGNGSANIDLAIDVPITGGALTKNGPGTMRLGATNSHTGQTTVNGGILLATSNNQLGASSVVAGPEGTLQLTGDVSYDLPLTIGGAGVSGVSLAAPGSPGALDSLSGDNTWSGPITLAGTGTGGTDPLLNQIGAQAGSFRINGTIQNGEGVDAAWGKTGNGDVILSGDGPNTYTGLTRLSGGRLIIEKDGALGSAGANNAAAGNTFQLPGSTSTFAFRAPEGSEGLNYATFEVINTSGSGEAGFGQVDSLGGNNTFAGQIAFDGPDSGGIRDASIGVSSDSLHVTGGLFARGNDGLPRRITKLGAGKLILSGDGGTPTDNPLVVPLVNSTFNIHAGTVETRGPSSTTANLPGISTWNVNNGGTLDAVSGHFSTTTLNVNSGGQFNLSGGSAAVSTLNLPSGSTLSFTGGELLVNNVSGDLINDGGTLSPGTSVGMGNIVGNYTQQDGASLLIEIGGTTPVSEHDFLVANVATLAGVLEVALANDFVPTGGQQFTVLGASSIVDNGLTLGTTAASLFNLIVGPNSVALEAISAGLSGDFNNDGVVDTADYVVWRAGLGTVYDEEDYLAWQANFGQTAGGGSRAGTSAAVPEPATFMLWGFATLHLCIGRRGRQA